MTKRGSGNGKDADDPAEHLETEEDMAGYLNIALNEGAT